MTHPAPICDTSPEAEALQFELCRRMPAWRKIELVDDAIRTSRHLAMMGLQSRHPGEPLTKLRRRLAGLVLGEEIAARVYGPLELGA